MTTSDQLWKTTRIYDEERGIGVEWLWDEPPMERATHFRLLLPDATQDFTAYYEFDTDILMSQRPELSWNEAHRLASEDPLVQYRAFNIRREFDREAFVEVWHKLLAPRHPSSKVRVVYSEFELDRPSQGSEWSRSS